jgi:hypothetical protein
MVPAKLLDAFKNDGVMTHNEVASFLNGFLDDRFCAVQGAQHTRAIGLRISNN